MHICQLVRSGARCVCASVWRGVKRAGFMPEYTRLFLSFIRKTTLSQIVVVPLFFPRLRGDGNGMPPRDKLFELPGRAPSVCVCMYIVSGAHNFINKDVLCICNWTMAHRSRKEEAHGLEPPIAGVLRCPAVNPNGLILRT